MSAPHLDAPAALPAFGVFARDVLGLDTSTREPALAFLAAVEGEPLTPEGVALVRRFTGRDDAVRPEGFRTAVLQSGRQSGKSEIVAAWLVYNAVRAHLAGRRSAWFVGVAQDHRAGMRALFAHGRRFTDAPLVRPLVTRTTADTIELGGVSIVICPCRPAAWRGLSIDGFACDELAHFRTGEGLPQDREVWRSALPALGMTGGRLIALSSPYLAAGLLYELHAAHYGKAGEDVLYWQSDGPSMNPKLDRGFLAQLQRLDPEAYEAEIRGEFLRDTSALLDEAVIAAAIDEGVTVRTPEHGVEYRGFLDLASGTSAGGDAAALGIAHATRSGTAVLDVAHVWHPPFSPASVAAEAAALLAPFRVRTVFADRWALGLSGELLRGAGLTYREAEHDRSGLYLQLAAGLNSGTVRLLDSPVLLRQLRGLERRRGPVKDRVDHRRNAHDDAANAAAGALSLAMRRPRSQFGFVNSNDAFAHLHL
jgi:hypothetical protein